MALSNGTAHPRNFSGFLAAVKEYQKQENSYETTW
jgi:hypothetical protein